MEDLSELEQVLVSTINETKGGIKAGVNFASEQIPDLVHQLLVFNLAQEIVIVAFAFGFIFAFAYFWERLKKFSHDVRDDAPIYLYTIFGGIFSVIALMVAIDSILDILKITLAPKIYLIEYAAALMR